MQNKSISIKSKVCSLKSSVCAPTSDLGFTLIELLVAMAILMVIVLMLSNLFQQSTRAWDSGMRQAEVGLEARAAVARIQKDLSQAIANSNYLFNATDDSLMFYTFQNDSTGTPQQVTYSAGSLPLPPDASFSVDTSYGLPGVGATNLPGWVEIELSMSSGRTFSGVRVYAAGRGYGEGETDWVDTHHDNN